MPAASSRAVLSDLSPGSDEEQEGHNKKKRKKDSKKHKKKHKKDSKKHKKKHKKHKKKSSKKSSKSKKENLGAIKTGYGAYGIISPVDMYKFQAEVCRHHAHEMSAACACLPTPRHPAG